MSKISLINKIESPPEYGSNIVLDLVNNPVSQSIMLGNTMQSKFSQFFQRQYDIGAVEWRMLVVLAMEPDATMSRVTEIIEMDKAAVSRALAKLDDKRLVQTSVTGTNARSKLWRLTPAGIALHDVILKASVEYIEQILEGIPEESLSAMLEAMKVMKQNSLAIDWDNKTS
jgi:DNA-binding MarR family transcriptional regulator